MEQENAIEFDVTDNPYRPTPAQKALGLKEIQTIRRRCGLTKPEALNRSIDRVADER